jgi:hypothetical protein
VVEHGIEDPGVGGSIPSWCTKKVRCPNGKGRDCKSQVAKASRFDSDSDLHCPIAQR